MAFWWRMLRVRRGVLALNAGYLAVYVQGVRGQKLCIERDTGRGLESLQNKCRAWNVFEGLFQKGIMVF